MHATPLTEISRTYESLFSGFNTETSPDMLAAIETAQSFGSRQTEVLKKLKKTIKVIVSSFGAFSMNYWTMLDTMQEFETICVSEYFGRSYQPLLKHNKREAFINPFEVLLAGARQELLDISSLLEAISSRAAVKSVLDKLHAKLDTNRKDITKLQSGKKTLKSYFSSKPSTQMVSDLEATVKQTEEEIYKIEALLRIITVRMGKAEIQEFNDKRLRRYQHMMRFFATSGIQEFAEISKVAEHIYFNESRH